ncbi:MAG: hypothetical protein ACK4F0_08365, partial [Candidatus Ratteibacteria bacterium]
YVRLADLSDPDLAFIHSDYPYGRGTLPYTPTSSPPQDGNYTFVYCSGTDYNNLQDSTDAESEITNGHNWDGPYITFQPKSIYQQDNGSVPIVSANGWGNLANIVPYGTPLDPWGHTYLVAYNNIEKVMIIYSAGPNGKIETPAGSTTSSGDDLLYKFR